MAVPADADTVLKAVRLGWSMSEVRGRNRPGWAPDMGASPAVATAAGPGAAGEAAWGAGWLPLDNELTLAQLRLEAQAALGKLASDLKVDKDGDGQPGSYSAEVNKQAHALANAKPGEVAQQWATLAKTIQDFDLHVQYNFALGPQTVACGYLLGRALADTYWALDPSLPDDPADPASWSFLFGSKRFSEMQRLLGRLSAYFHPYTAAAIAGSVQVWRNVATTTPGLRADEGAYSRLYQQIRHWYELVLLNQDPTTLLKPYQLLRHLGLVRRTARLFWAQILMAALAAGALTGFAWLLSRPNWSAGLATLLGALAITGVSVAALTAKLKNDAQAVITRIKQDAYTDLIVAAITTAPMPGTLPASGPFQPILSMAKRPRWGVWRTVGGGLALVVAAVGGAAAAVAEAAPWLGLVVAVSVLALVVSVDKVATAGKDWSPGIRRVALDGKDYWTEVAGPESADRAPADMAAVIESALGRGEREAHAADDAGAGEAAGPGRVPGPAESTLRPVERYVVVAGPEAVTAGNTFEISVAVLRDQPDDIPDAVPIGVTPSVDAAGHRTGDPVTVTVYASDAFKVISDRKATLEVIPGADPEPAVIRIKSLPSARGPQVLLVVLFQGWRVLGEVRLVIKVRAQALVSRLLPASSRYINPSPGPLIRRSLVVPALQSDDVADPDVAIHVTWVPSRGQDTLHYSYVWLAAEWPSVEAGSYSLPGTLGEWLRPRLEELSVAARRPVSVGRAGRQENEHARKYEVIGENLWDLFPPDLREFYSRFAPTARTLLIFSDEPWIPWELVKPWGDEFIKSEFLCAKFEMSRWYYNDQCQIPNVELAVREVAPVLPPSNLTAVQEEADYFEQLPDEWPPVVRYTPLPARCREVSALLTSGRAQVLHFATHGVLQGDGDHIASIVLQDGELKADEIVGDEIAKGLRRATPLVFMNACHSGRQVIGLTGADGWVERYLKLGCRGFLGANWEVNDELAAEFAIQVYGGLVAGFTIARAVREARLHLRELDNSNPTWLAYSLYAHPNMTLRPASEDLT